MYSLRTERLVGMRNGNQVDRLGRTPLHNAVIDDDAARVELLLRSGADANVADQDGSTPLHFAAQNQFLAVGTLLLDGGAITDARDRWGNTPLSKAVFTSRGSGQFIQLLRERGADPYAANNYGVAPVGLARTIANYDVAGFFADLPLD
jgi:ankyrin repeat protein